MKKVESVENHLQLFVKLNGFHLTIGPRHELRPAPWGVFSKNWAKLPNWRINHTVNICLKNRFPFNVFILVFVLFQVPVCQAFRLNCVIEGICLDFVLHCRASRQ